MGLVSTVVERHTNDCVEVTPTMLVQIHPECMVWGVTVLRTQIVGDCWEKA